jgi:TolB-like protein
LRRIQERGHGVPGDSGASVRLQEQPLEILRLMLERPGEVITRDELRQRLWPDGTFVDFEHSLNAGDQTPARSVGRRCRQPDVHRDGPATRATGSSGSVPAGEVTAAAPSAPHLRLVVLPFSNLSDDSSQEYFSDGLTEELIAQLGPLCRGQVGIIARWSSMFFKGSLQRACEIGEALKAEYLLEGSTRRDGSRVRITARTGRSRDRGAVCGPRPTSAAPPTGSRYRPMSPAVSRARFCVSWCRRRGPVGRAARPSACLSGLLEGEVSLGETGRCRAATRRCAASARP